jgi:hypothetical protein
MDDRQVTEATPTVRCAKCGQQSRRHAQHCRHCGAHLYLSCRHCGESNERIAKYCHACHTRLHRTWWRRVKEAYFRKVSLVEIVVGFIAVIVVIEVLLRLASSLPGWVRETATSPGLTAHQTNTVDEATDESPPATVR